MVVAFASAAGCAEPEVVLRLEGSLSIPGCSSPLPWSAEFGTLTRTEDGGVLLRFQEAAGPLDQDDALLLDVHDAARASSNEALAVRPAEGSGGDVIGSLLLAASCPGSRTLSPGFVGEVRFDEFGAESGSRVAGELRGDVVDARDPATVWGTGIVGTFDFIVRDFPPYQAFGLLAR